MGRRSHLAMRPLPPLQLSAEDVMNLRQVADHLEAESLRMFEAHVYEHAVNASQWKPMKWKDSVCVYGERSTRRSDWNVVMEPSKVPVLLAEGLVAGAVDEAMFAESVFDSRSLWLRNAVLKDDVAEAAVVSTLEAPTLEDPFQFLGVVWMVKSYSGFGFIKPRDMLVLRSQRMTTTSRGERIGVIVQQSIAHKDMPELSAQLLVRMRVSSAVIFRQVDQDHVQVFALQHANPMGHGGAMAEAKVTSEAVKSLLNLANLPKAVHERKLHALVMARSPPSRTLTMQESFESDNIDLGLDKLEPLEPLLEEQACCACCNRALGKRFQASGVSCHLCGMVVCSKCRVRHKVLVGNEQVIGGFEPRPVIFCVTCWLHSKNCSSWSIARDIVEHCGPPRSLRETSGACTVSDSSSNSARHLVSLIDDDACLLEEHMSGRFGPGSSGIINVS